MMRSSFREWKEKFDFIDDDAEDTLTYHYRNRFIFRQDLSAPGLTGDEIIIMPHPCKYQTYLVHSIVELKENHLFFKFPLI